MIPLLTVWLELIRIKHWVKNLFIFIPFFFAGQLLEARKYPQLIAGFIAFSFVASAVYIFNDICDYKFDLSHPVKKDRPIPSGRVSRTSAIILLVVLALSGISLAWYLSPVFFLLVLSYFVMNLAYSLGLKNFSIIDILIIAVGFVMRVYAGGVLANVPVSHWLAIMILLLSLFLALAKRRDDLVVNKDGKVRKSISQYNLEFVNVCLSIFGGIIAVSYIMYTLSSEVTERFNTEWLFLTSIFVIAGIMRYLQIIYIDNNSGYPTAVLYKDRFIILTLISWLTAFCIIIYV